MLKRATSSRDSFNAPVKTWVTLADVACSKRDVSDAERARADQLGASITTRFVIRWSVSVADLSALDQAEFEGRRYEIRAVKELGRREGLEISAAALADVAP